MDGRPSVVLARKGECGPLRTRFNAASSIALYSKDEGGPPRYLQPSGRTHAIELGALRCCTRLTVPRPTSCTLRQRGRPRSPNSPQRGAEPLVTDDEYRGRQFSVDCSPEREQVLRKIPQDEGSQLGEPLTPQMPARRNPVVRVLVMGSVARKLLVLQSGTNGVLRVGCYGRTSSGALHPCRGPVSQ